MTAITASDVDEVPSKHTQVLDAAQVCFVRHGFRGASMNDIARATAMSVGNLYRYFASKEALIIGLVERECERASVLASTVGHDQVDRAQFLGLVERHLLAIDRDEAVMRVEIWAEASRNPAVAAVVRSHEQAARAWMLDMITSRITPPTCEPAMLLDNLAPFLNGVVVAKATMPDYDFKAAIAHVRALLGNGVKALPSVGG